MTSTVERPVYIEPQGVHLPRPGKAAVARRAARVSGALAAEVGPYAFDRLMRRRSDRTIASALRKTCERLGATYVKFGQAVASSPAVLPAGIAEEFRSCLDQGPPVPWPQVRRIVEHGLGQPIDALYSQFDHKPMAAASIAVVHKAKLLDGTPVAVKVLRPGIGRVVAADLDLMEPFFRFLARQGIGEVGNAVAYLVGLRHQIAEELDLRNEVRTMDYFRTLFERFSLDRLVIPKVYESHSSRRVLTMEFIEGGPIDDALLVAKYDVDPQPLVRELLQAWVLTALGAGVFHADIHAGNLFLMPDGRLAMLDWGVVARLDEATKDLFTALVETALGREEAWNVVANHMIRSQGALLEEGFGATHADVLDMVRMYMEPVLTKPLREVSMAAVFMSPEQARAMNHGEAMPQRTLREKWTQNRLMAQAFRKAMDRGHFEEEMQRQTFLAAKQLLYLERYGRMYTPDEALLGDKEFLLRALELQGE